MTKMPCSVIIPTLNEQFYIGKLLDSISKQTILPKEVVIVDAYSSDQTKSAVQKRSAQLPSLKFYQIKRSTIAKQRNFGVLKTTSPNLLFLDADVILQDPATLEKYLHEVNLKKPDITSAVNKPLSTNPIDQLIFGIMDNWFKLIKPFHPVAMGINIYVTRKMFDEVGGFNEKLIISEDHEFVFRAVKHHHAKFMYLQTPRIHSSIRRLEKEGRIGFAIKATQSFFQDLIKGYNQNSVSKKYNFGDHPSTVQTNKKMKFKKMVKHEFSAFVKNKKLRS